MSIDAILGQAETSNQTTKSKTESDKEMFLKLLVAQLSYQDPMNPVEDKEFIAQLAQFTSVEELQNIRSGMEEVTNTIKRGELIDAVSLIGARVVAAGDRLTKVAVDAPKVDDDGNPIKDDDGNPVTEEVQYVSTAYYTNEVDLETCTVTIRDAASNVIVHTEELGKVAAGSHEYKGWSGKLSDGQIAPDGFYDISFTGYDAYGQSQLLKVEVIGDVSQVENIGGEYYLHLADYRMVKYVDVGLVGVPSN